ncbi:hypothetical protein BLA6863_03270 [Burkholderia lata]|uniref:Uncharacterized protein n=2 Tax=Burkholderia lata (strain ATCC 17760 / DSM 23089 / LMG 22485 / NCIMB 9086 / R18194 / 383) TaxID=482957 RepID=A0A6P2LL84_BURL3|nr:hypothetical protein BLA6863_03270 [Burkholderia lata]
MKMARASKADLDAALDVSNVIEQLEKGWMPYADDSDKLERFDRYDAKLCQRALAAILDAASTGNLFRVTFGMTVVLDQRNELLDPAADTLELHPKLVAALDGASRAPVPHSDDLAVDRFSAVMKAKLAEKRAAGRGGWDDPTQCHVTTLARYLVEHVAKGDPVDVGNFAMMLHQRAAGPHVLPGALHVYTHPEPLKGGK